MKAIAAGSSILFIGCATTILALFGYSIFFQDNLNDQIDFLLLAVKFFWIMAVSGFVNLLTLRSN